MIIINVGFQTRVIKTLLKLKYLSILSKLFSESSSDISANFPCEYF